MGLTHTRHGCMEVASDCILLNGRPNPIANLSDRESLTFNLARGKETLPLALLGFDAFPLFTLCFQ